jgi:hypothetical protein
MKPTNNGRGQVEVQFNWIFILIVGAIILAFFITISLRQKEASETEATITFFTNFEKALSGIAAVQGKQLLFEVPKMDLRYDCTAACDCAAYAGTRARATALFPMNDKIIFSPNKLQGNDLLTWSKDWSYPFRVSNFLFITSPGAKYLVEKVPQGENLYNNLPPLSIEREGEAVRAFDKQLFEPTIPITAGVTGNYKVKFIFFEANPEEYQIPSALLTLTNTDVTAIKIERMTAQSPELVKFYQKQGQTFRLIGQSYLFGETTTYAAVFAEDLTAYSCMMNRAFRSLNFVSKIYAEKQGTYNEYIRSLQQGSLEHQRLSQCAIHYSTAALQTLTGADFSTLDEVTATNIIQSVRNIANQNNNALKGSCPHIY